MLASVQDWLLNFICVGSLAGMFSCLGLSLSKKSELSEEEMIDSVNEALKVTDLKIKKDDSELFIIVTNATIKDDQQVYRLHIPHGLSYESLKKKQDVIENALKTKVNLINKDYQYFLMIKEEKKLENKYPFEIVPVPNKDELFITIGMTTEGPLTVNMSSSHPHGLLGGTSGGGKSRTIKGILLNLMENYDPSELRISFLDNKGGVEGNTFLECEHFETITTNVYETVNYLDTLKNEMESRLIKIRSAKVTNIVDYNKKNNVAKIPFLFVILDELYPFLALKDKHRVYENLADLLSRGRAAGVHVCIATQKATTDVLPSFISANTTLILSHMTRNEQESKNFIGRSGLENVRIKGRGVCLTDREIEFQSFWVDDSMVERICKKHRKKQQVKIVEQVKIKKDITTKKEEFESKLI